MSRRVDGVEESPRASWSASWSPRRRLRETASHRRRRRGRARGPRASRERCRDTQVLKIIEGGMIPVLCIGETKEEFDANLCESVCAIQLAKDLAGVSAADVKTMIIAYEPVWAIGTGLVCPSETAQKVHKFLRGKLSEMYDQATADAVRIQYGV